MSSSLVREHVSIVIVTRKHQLRSRPDIPSPLPEANEDDPIRPFRRRGGKPRCLKYSVLRHKEAQYSCYRTSSLWSLFIASQPANLTSSRSLSHRALSSHTRQTPVSSPSPLAYRQPFSIHHLSFARSLPQTLHHGNHLSPFNPYHSKRPNPATQQACRHKAARAALPPHENARRARRLRWPHRTNRPEGGFRL